MARLVTSGFEWRQAAGAGGLIEGNIAGVGTWTVETASHRSGTAAASITLTSAGLSQRNFAFGDVGVTVTAYARVYWRKTGNPGTNQRTICAFNNGSIGYGFMLNTDGTVSFVWKDGSGTIATLGTSGVALANDTYYRLEWSQLIDVANTVFTGEGRIDGGTIGSETAVSRGSTLRAQSLMCGTDDTNSHTGAVTYIFDDLAVNDSSGASQNSWPGSAKVVLLRPVTPDNARGANWVGGAGGTTNLFDAMDNTPPVGVVLASASNTSQIKNVTKDTTGNYDANLTTYTTAGITAADTVNVVHPHWNVGASGSGISHAMLLVSNPAANGGVESTFSPAVTAGTYPTNWAWQLAAAQVVYSPSVVLGTSPVIRIGKRTSSTTAAMCDAMGAYVDFTPPASLLPTPPFRQTSTNYRI